MKTTPNSLSDFLNRCIDHSKENLGKPIPEYELFEDDMEVFSWPQTWADTSIGQGGIAGQMITKAQTVVIIGPMGDVCVYHNRFSYKVKNPSDKFYECMRSWRLPGKSVKRDFLEKK